MSMEWLKTAFTEPTGLQLSDIVVRLSSSFVFGLAIAGLHVWTRPPQRPESPRLGSSLVMLCVLIAVVSQVVGNNAARAFSLVGAVSVIRFRTPLEDTRDTAFVLFSVILGMAAGVGYFEVGIAGLAAGGLTSLGFRLRNITPSAGVWCLDIRVAVGKPVERILENGVASLMERCDFVSGSTLKKETLMEYRYKVVLKSGVTPLRLLAELGKHEDCQGVDIKQV
ncbi:DUF4956 domain-containing protein [Zavarzinella formosa]|uniref:DUF4956 domain-containing protein n=1 Tax=Zavarzinella formosa TaxID=360055 RepID=UPI0003113E8E|nr:DUF4956 domain-containing protein [Zavarzinella formosa]